MIFPWNLIPMMPNYDFFRPPLLYNLMNSMTNFGAEEQTKIKDLARVSSSQIFDFDYPLSNKVDKEDFETMILNHFIDRRIGFETYTLFHIKLENKMNEIMPYYNKIFDSFDDWNLFNDGGNITKDSTDNRQTSSQGTKTTSKQSSGTQSAQSSSTTSGTNDKRKSDMPQNAITEIQNGQYLTDYEYDTSSASDSSSSSGTSSGTESGTDTTSENGTDSNAYHETTTTDVSNKIEVYERFLENKNKTMNMIYDDLESLFYGLLN